MTYRQEVETEEHLQALKDKCLKCKIILMEKEGKHPLTNLSLFSKRQKDKFIAELDNMMKTWSDDQINSEFNSIVSDDLLEGTKDVSVYPCMQASLPDHTNLYEPEKMPPPPPAIEGETI